MIPGAILSVFRSLRNLTHIGCKQLAIGYRVRDLVIPTVVQKKEIEVTSIETEYTPKANHPKLVVDWILQVARKIEGGFLSGER